MTAKLPTKQLKAIESVRAATLSILSPQKTPRANAFLTECQGIRLNLEGVNDWIKQSRVDALAAKYVTDEIRLAGDTLAKVVQRQNARIELDGLKKLFAEVCPAVADLRDVIYRHVTGSGFQLLDHIVMNTYDHGKNVAAAELGLLAVEPDAPIHPAKIVGFYIAPDTNVLIHFKNITQYCAKDVLGKMVPQEPFSWLLVDQVVRELDQKSHHPEVFYHRRARKLQRLIETAHGDPTALGRGSHAVVFLPDEHPVVPGLDLEVPDHVILAQAVAFQQTNPGAAVLILTNDVGMTLRAQQLGFGVLKPHPDTRRARSETSRVMDSAVESEHQLVTALEQSMLCIICMKIKAVRPLGRGEHVIPYALGGSFKIKRVCLECDNDLGNKADAGLINLTAMEERRAELGLAGHNGVVPNPAAKLLTTALVNVNDPEHKIVREVSDSGEIIAKTKTVVEFRVEQFDEGLLIEPARVYIDPSDAPNAAMHARSALKKAGIKDEAVLERISREFAEGLETVETTGEFLQKVTRIEGGHQVGLLKIAYELAWNWLGDDWLSDPVAVEMREMLTGRKKTIRLRAKILDDPNEAIIAVDGDQRVLHVAYAYPFDGQVLLFIRLFDFMAVGFSITETAEKYTVAHLNAIVMQNVQRQYEEVHMSELGASQVIWTHDPQNSPIK